MEKKTTLLQFTLNYGAILGIVSVIFSLILYITGFMPVNIKRIVLISLIGLAITIVFVSAGMKGYRDKVLGGTITYKQALLVGVMIVVFSTILTSFYNLIFNLYIDPEYNSKVIEASKNWTYDWMNNIGAPEGQIEDTMERYDKQLENSTPLKTFFQSLYMSAIFGFILSLIIAAFTKKNRNPVA